jgi:MFS transporter, MHS family, shikimate and dehydroshikimate transport protein
VFGGGVAPFIATALLAATGAYWPKALYMIAMAAITIVSVFIAVETSGLDVHGETHPDRRAAEKPAGGVG